MDRELLNLMHEGIEQAKRIGDAFETLVNEPLVEIKSAPPQCPHCGTINPEIKTQRIEEATGKIADFVLLAICNNCENDIFCNIVEWAIQADQQAAVMVGKQISERINQ